MIKIFVLLYIIGTVSCIYKYLSQSPVSNSLSNGLLNSSSFSYTPSNFVNGFPSKIQLNANILGYQLDLNLFQIEGIANNASLSSRVLIKNSLNPQINELESENLTYSLYSDENYKIFATLIDNNDLIERGVDTGGYDFRIFMSIMIDGTQVDFQAAILGYFDEEPYQHYYTIRASIAGSDLNDKFSNETVINPCDLNPCQNNGTCQIGLANRFSCLCPENFIGDTCEDDLTGFTLCPECNQNQIINNRTANISQPLTQCNPNPCKNGANCKISLNKEYFTCFCTPQYTGQFCNLTQPDSKNNLNIGKVLKNKPSMKKSSSRMKRDDSPLFNQSRVNLFVDYLVVIDSSVYNLFLSQYGYMPDSLITNYINIFFCHLVNGINQRFYNSLANDTELMLTISLANVLILNDDSLTPWTDVNLVGVPGYDKFNDNSLPALLSSASIMEFLTTMNNMELPFNYDYAVAVLNYDLWSSDFAQLPSIRRATIGISAAIPGICLPFKYSMLEFNGFLAIHNGAHELGHVLGAIHDGTVFNGINATKCNASANYIMTPVIGKFYNGDSLHYFSNCSIEAFKATILDSEASTGGHCLSTEAGKLSIEFEKAYGDKFLPGQMYSVDDQCKLIYGTNSNYCNGTYRLGNRTSANDLIMCRFLLCYTGNIPNSPCTVSGNGVMGLGALDGTPCYSNDGILTPGLICLKGSCVNESLVSLPTCDPNPCLNGGECTLNNLNSSFVCNCADGFSGLTCAIMQTTEMPSIGVTTNSFSTTPLITVTETITRKRSNICTHPIN